MQITNSCFFQYLRIFSGVSIVANFYVRCHMRETDFSFLFSIKLSVAYLHFQSRDESTLFPHVSLQITVANFFFSSTDLLFFFTNSLSSSLWKYTRFAKKNYKGEGLQYGWDHQRLVKRFFFVSLFDSSHFQLCLFFHFVAPSFFFGTFSLSLLFSIFSQLVLIVFPFDDLCS